MKGIKVSRQMDGWMDELIDAWMDGYGTFVDTHQPDNPRSRWNIF